MLPGIHHEILPPQAASSSARHQETFLGGQFQTARIHGHCDLVRLVQGSRFQQERPGDFWMSATLFHQARQQADQELRQQAISPEKLAAYAGLFTRFVLRDQLAISRDWSDLDMFVSLSIPPGTSLIAQIGEARMQPYYSPSDPAHAGAEAAGIRLPGLGTQIVIDFQNPENQYAARLISPPIVF